MKFEKLGKPERRLLLRALDIDSDNLKCQYCSEKTTYDVCGIMPPIGTKMLATIVCYGSPLCIIEYLQDLEDFKEKKKEKK